MGFSEQFKNLNNDTVELQSGVETQLKPSRRRPVTGFKQSEDREQSMGGSEEDSVEKGGDPFLKSKPADPNEETQLQIPSDLRNHKDPAHNPTCSQIEMRNQLDSVEQYRCLIHTPTTTNRSTQLQSRGHLNQQRKFSHLVRP